MEYSHVIPLTLLYVSLTACGPIPLYNQRDIVRDQDTVGTTLFVIAPPSELPREKPAESISSNHPLEQNELHYMPLGYHVDKSLEGSVLTLVGLYSGSLHLQIKKADAVYINGEVSLRNNSQFLEQVVRDADINGDKEVTHQEVSDLLQKILNKRISKRQKKK